MTTSRLPTRQRIVNSALELFARQGITETTTRQIADQADINEVTLFRHFGNKHGLLLAVLQECLQKYIVMTQVGESLMISEASGQLDLTRFLRYYVQSSLQVLEGVPELMRSLVGEAGQYPLESRQALAQGIAQINQSIASALREVMAQSHIELPLPPLKLANLINTCILGYAVVVLTSDAQTVWTNRDEFIATLVDLIARDVNENTIVVDIPADAVRETIMQAKRSGLRDYAIAYVLFGAGLKPEELISLKQDDYIISTQNRVLRVGDSIVRHRFVPINQKVLGHRYGSATHNPLTSYLKARKDKHAAMFLGEDLQQLELAELQQLWQKWTQQLCNLDNTKFQLSQARQTWGVEMLIRGMDIDNFRIISGFKSSEIEHYQRRVREKVAIDQAIALDV